MTNDPTIPSEANPFISLHQLLYTKEDQVALSNPGALATAIEQGGIWGWDRYGRFRNLPYGSEEAQEALDIIAEEYAYSNQTPYQVDDESEFYRDLIDPLDPAFGFGWAKAVLPSFLRDPSSTANPAPRKSAETRAVSSLHKIISGLAYGLNFDISETNKTRVSTVQDYLAQLGHELDNNTVREHLKAAAKLIKTQ